ncbi:hypothetical protein F5144DRAFT_372440 [Chaetomium tenue]|uniref:Uncharacterized protein n=1 Tax=Chaetomium tenue TaxID=1854479 RepID=A0ACB7NZF5_9PEZI|nr:hypothetical protein F5144DRAFT_372440 [Chaetomium globosum]
MKLQPNPLRSVLCWTGCCGIPRAETGGGDKNGRVGKAVDMYSHGVPRYSHPGEETGMAAWDNWLLYHRGVSGAEGHIKSAFQDRGSDSGKIILKVDQGEETQRNGTDRKRSKVADHNTCRRTVWLGTEISMKDIAESVKTGTWGGGQPWVEIKQRRVWFTESSMVRF